MNKRKRILSFGAAFAIGIISAATVLTACAPPPSEDIFVREDLAAQINADIPKDTTASIRVGIRATNAEEKIMNGLIEAFNERAASRRARLIQAVNYTIKCNRREIKKGTHINL